MNHNRPRLHTTIARIPFALTPMFLWVSGCALPTQQLCPDCPACQLEYEEECRAKAEELARRPRPAEARPLIVPASATAETESVAGPPPLASVPGANDANTRLMLLEDELHRLQQERNDELSHQKRLQLAVYAMGDRVEQLTSQVDHWKGEVSRLESEAVSQHKADLASMEQLAVLLEEIPAPEPRPDDQN